MILTILKICLYREKDVWFIGIKLCVFVTDFLKMGAVESSSLESINKLSSALDEIEKVLFFLSFFFSLCLFVCSDYFPLFFICSFVCLFVCLLEISED